MVVVKGTKGGVYTHAKPSSIIQETSGLRVTSRNSWFSGFLRTSTSCQGEISPNLTQDMTSTRCFWRLSQSHISHRTAAMNTSISLQVHVQFSFIHSARRYSVMYLCDSDRVCNELFITKASLHHLSLKVTGS